MSFDISRPLPEFNGRPIEYVKPGSQPTQRSYIQLTGNVDPTNGIKTIGVNVFLAESVNNPFSGAEVKSVVCDTKLTMKLSQDQITDINTLPQRVSDVVLDLLKLAIEANPRVLP